MRPSSISLYTLILGVLLLVSGINIYHDGWIRGVVIGQERHSVGIVVFFFGVYFICLGLGRWRK